jgi:diketogulonate reductase-like aldo/keto reductase
MSKHVDTLLWKWSTCKTDDECRETWKEVLEYLERNWIYLVGWSQFEAFGSYYVSKDLKRCIYIGRNLRVDPVVRWIDEIKFSDLTELANRIWRDQKGVIPFKKIKEHIKEVFGVDVKMTPENKLIRALFGEASE